jgi:hypothetical protein
VFTSSYILGGALIALGDELFATGSWAGQVAKCPLKRG